MKYRLQELCEKITDGSHYSPKGEEIGYPMFSVKDMLEYGFDYSNCKKISQLDYQKMVASGCVPQKGDVLVAKDGSYLKQIFVCEETREEAILSSIAIFRPNTDFIESDYLCYLLRSPKVYNYITTNCVSGSALPRIVLKTFKDIELEVPSLDEQKKVVSILKSLDEKIKLNHKINKNLEEQALALFKSYFIDYDNFNGQAPYTWKKGVLGDFVEIKRGGSPRPIQNYLSDCGLHWLKISDATCITSPFINEIKEYIIEDGLKKTVFLKAGALVLSNSATPGLPKILDIDTCIHDGWLYFPTSRLSNEYLYLFFKHIREKLVALGNGSVFTNLKTDILKNYPSFLPTQEILCEFDGIVKPLFEMILATTREIKNLITLRDTLLPKLMSGELDVSELDI